MNASLVLAAFLSAGPSAEDGGAASVDAVPVAPVVRTCDTGTCVADNLP